VSEYLLAFLRAGLCVKGGEKGESEKDKLERLDTKWGFFVFVLACKCGCGCVPFPLHGNVAHSPCPPLLHSAVPTYLPNEQGHGHG
jgi:hypothetical protein